MLIEDMWVPPFSPQMRKMKRELRQLRIEIMVSFFSFIECNEVLKGK